MKKSIYSTIFCAALLLASGRQNINAQDASASSTSTPSREAGVLVSVTATVESINQDTRELTLKGPLGNSVTLTVDKRVKRLNKVKVGDEVTADYFVSLAAELRKPTPEEEKNPIQVVEVAGKTSADAPPGAGAMRQYKVVTTIEGLDRPTQTVTVKGPMGHYVTARVKRPEVLNEMQLGENIVVTYTEAMAVSLHKVDKKSGD